jgi:hypothetical protein
VDDAGMAIHTDKISSVYHIYERKSNFFDDDPNVERYRAPIMSGEGCLKDYFSPFSDG